MKSCYFVFNHSVLLCPYQYSINLRNSRFILVHVLSTAEPSWTLHSSSLWLTRNCSWTKTVTAFTSLISTLHTTLVSHPSLSHNRYSLYKLHTDRIENIFHSWLLLLQCTQLKVVYRPLPRNGDSSVVALCVFGLRVFIGPLPSNALAIHVKICYFFIVIISNLIHLWLITHYC
jgi:hypothetical protein